jgi:hypothetical protein
MKPHKQAKTVTKKIPRCGDIVQVKENSSSRVFWHVGQISELLPSRDSKTRTARVKLSNGNVIIRSISHLYPLEMDDDPLLNDKKTSDSDVVPSVDSTHDIASTAQAPQSPIPSEVSCTDKSTRPRREAADVARAKIRLLTENLLILSAGSNAESHYH